MKNECLKKFAEHFIAYVHNHVSIFGFLAGSTILFCSPQTAFGNIINNLVADVSQVNLQDHVAKIAAGARFTTTEKEKAASYIEDALKSYGYSVYSDAANNLVATLPGVSFPQKNFIVGAHYDTVNNTPGADDNASGVAGMLEIARVFSSVRERVADTIKFVAFADEEIGFLGSAYFAQAAKAANEDIIGMISLEMIGYTSTNSISFPDISGCLDVSDNSSLPQNYIAGISTTGRMLAELQYARSEYVPNLKVETGHLLDGSGNCFGDSRRSDHARFWDQGYDAMMITDMGNFRNPNYHLQSDAYSTLDFAFMTDVVRATTAFIAIETIPEPPVAVLFASGIAALLVMRRKPDSLKKSLQDDVAVGGAVF